MSVIVSQLINGIALGCTYALVSIGFNLLWLVAGIIHFTYPAVVVLVMYIMWLVFESTRSIALMLLSAVVCGPVLLLMSAPLFQAIVRRGLVMQTFIMSLAIGIMIGFLTSQVINHGYPVSFSESLASRGAAVKIGYAVISWGQILIIIGSVTLVFGLFIVLYKTMIGRALRAIAQDKQVAHLVGISDFRTGIVSYVLAGLIAGLTAIFLAMSAGSAYNGLSENLSLKMIAVVLFAGSGNLVGGLIAALILGIVETLTTGFLSGQWSNAVAFGMILIVVMFRPQGLLGSRS